MDIGGTSSRKKDQTLEWAGQGIGGVTVPGGVRDWPGT